MMLFQGVSGKPLDAYYTIFISIRKDFRMRLDALIPGKHILECGCGINSYAYELAPFVQRINGIDISDEAVRQSEEEAARAGIQNCSFHIMNAENLEFEDNTFDLLFGVGIIHHLDLDVFYAEAARVLNPEGRMLFMEPLGYNPFLNLYRKMTPRLRTPDEHPLLRKDLRLIHRFFGDVVVKYYHFFTLLAVPFRKTRLFSPCLHFLESLDQICFRYLPGFKYLAWYTIIEAGLPKKPVRHSST
jgi:ubiquinone/menaquinone biosynthesis C-methylase UbiE